MLWSVTGAVCFLGLMLGRTTADDDEAYRRTTQVVGGLLQDFVAENGHAECSQLTGYDPQDPEQRSKFASDSERKIDCRRLVMGAARMAVQQVQTSGHQPK